MPEGILGGAFPTHTSALTYPVASSTTTNTAFPSAPPGNHKSTLILSPNSLVLLPTLVT